MVVGPHWIVICLPFFWSPAKLCFHPSVETSLLLICGLRLGWNPIAHCRSTEFGTRDPATPRPGLWRLVRGGLIADVAFNWFLQSLVPTTEAEAFRGTSWISITIAKYSESNSWTLDLVFDGFDLVVTGPIPRQRMELLELFDLVVFKFDPGPTRSWAWWGRCERPWTPVPGSSVVVWPGGLMAQKIQTRKWWLCLHNAMFPDKSISMLRCLFYWDARNCWANSWTVVVSRQNWVREGVWRVICCVSIIVHCLKTSNEHPKLCQYFHILPLLPAAFFVRERSPDSGSTLQADVSDSSTANLLRAVAEATHEERSVQHWGGLIQRIQHHFRWSVSLSGIISGLCWCKHTRKCWSLSRVDRNWHSHLCPVVFVGSMKDMSLWLVVWDCVLCCCI